MAQQLKEEVLDRICKAAVVAFAERGYAQTRLTDVALEAGVSTGNIYRYFADKEALFLTVAPRSKAKRFRSLLRDRLDALATNPGWESEFANPSQQAKALLDFLVEERSFVLIALGDRGDSPLGATHASVISYFEQASEELAKRNGAAVVPALVMQQVFTSTVDMILAILRGAESRAAIQQACEAFSRYQLAGLQALLSVPRASHPPDQTQE